jgi:hypothetical protein
MSWMTCGSGRLSPSTIASAAATLLIATRRLATYFHAAAVAEVAEVVGCGEMSASSGRTLRIALGHRWRR